MDCEKQFLKLGWMHRVLALLSKVEPESRGYLPLKVIIFQKIIPFFMQ
jgi:hypothetical protein